MNNITIGQYVKGNSYLHRLDPRIKILATIILIISIFLIPANGINNLYVLLGILGLFILILLFGKIPLLSVIKGLQPVLFIGLFTFFLQIIYNTKGTLIYDFQLSFSLISILAVLLLIVVWFIILKYLPMKMLSLFGLLILSILAFVYLPEINVFGKANISVYSSGLISGAFFCLRFMLVIMVSTILTISTSTTDINLGLEWLLHPLTFIKVPVGVFAMMLSLTLRFVPTLMIETDKIMKAQASRGIDFNEGNIFQKAKQMISLLIPMLVISLNRAEDLANAMEARGYIIGAKRTNISELKFRLIDLFASCFLCLFFTGAIILAVI